MTRNPVIWSLVQRFGSDALSYATVFILAILLSPEDFGIVGIASLWVALISTLSELGLSSALIQRESIRPEHLSTTFFLSLAVGIALAAGGVLGSSTIARLFRAPEATPVVAVLSLGFLMTSISTTQQALALRELRLADVAVRDIAAASFGGFSAIVLAYRGFGVWSLVVQNLAAGAMASLLLWRISPWRPRLKEVSLRAVRELWRYSSSMFLFNFLKFLSQNIDRLVVGRLLGAPMLGLYNFAHRLVVYPASALAGAFGQYQFPSFSRMQENIDRVRSSYLSFNRASATVVLPAVFALAVVSPAIIPALFGERWSAAVPLTRLLAIVALSVTVMSPMGNLMKALGRPGWLLRWSVGFTILVTAFLWVGSSWGVVGAVAGVAGAYALSLPAVYYLTAKLLGLGIGDFLRPFVPSTVASAVAVAALLLTGLVSPMPDVGRLLLGGGLGLVAYCLVILRMDRPFLVQVFDRVRGK